MHIKNWQYYFIIGIPAVICIIYFFCPLYPITSTNNETMFSSIFGWKFNDGSVFAALLTSIITILGTHYSVNKNYKSIKLSSLPYDSVNLLIDMEYKFDKYKTCEDEFILLTEILKDWKDHQKAFKLLTPKFYSEFLRIINKFMEENSLPLTINEKELIIKETEGEHLREKDKDIQNDKEKTTETEVNENTKRQTNEGNPKNKKNYGNENSKYILKALLVQITNIAFENDKCYFEFINPESITDDNIRELGEDLKNYIPIKITTPDLKEYVNSIAGNTTRKLTNEKFETLKKEIKNLINNLKREIEEYD